jgi:pantoate--beta-alanine ligase
VLDEADGVEPDYVALVDPDTLTDVADDHRGDAVLLVAARVGSTRLIDNVRLTFPLPGPAS